MNQQFTKDNMLGFYRKADEYKIGEVNLDLLESISENIYSEDFIFENFTLINNYINLQKIDIHKLLVLRKLNFHIKKLYKVKQSDRKSIIKQVKVLLSEKSRKIYVTRLDIKDFYPSINRDKVLRKIVNNDYLLSYHSKILLNKLFTDNEQIKAIKGLPFGLNLSATLSELYMRDFDKKIASIDGIYYYARYVDDIIIFSYKDTDIESLILHENYLPQGLVFNQEKVYKKEIDIKSDFEIDFLGYKFNVFNNDKSINKRTISISIAENKVNKIKNRIIKSFLDYFKNKDFNLLLKRVAFLTGNHVIYHNEGRKLKGGLYYSYEYITNYSVLKELDVFLRKIIFSRNGSIGKKNSLSSVNKKNLLKYSFLFGFEKKLLNNFSNHEISKIKRCW